MAAILDVWIARPGVACLVDDHEWLVRVYDAHGNIFQWAGNIYNDLSAPQAHWAGTIPPGCYVVQAVNTKTGVKTDHAIVTVGCDGVACVRLFVAGKDQPPPPRCQITITEVTGIGEPVATSIVVKGTAVNCSKVEVSATCAGDKAVTKTTAVTAGGDWTAEISGEGLRCRCGRPVTVTAHCVEQPECRDQFQIDKLKCQPRGKKSDKKPRRVSRARRSG